MQFASLSYEIAPGGATEAVLHTPAIVIVLILLPTGDTGPKQPAGGSTVGQAATLGGAGAAGGTAP
jgi:hypothetical protein